MIIGVVLKPKKQKYMSQEKRLLELVVHTPTLEELKKVVKVAKDVGYSVPDIDLDRIYQDDKENTCIFISKENWSIMSKSWYKSSDFKIISFKAFIDYYVIVPNIKIIKTDKDNWLEKNAVAIKSCADQITGASQAGEELAKQLINSISHFSKVQYENKIKDLEQKLANEIKERTQLQKDFDNIVNECERLENLPKVGDTCIFWEKNCKEVTVGVLKEIRTDKHFPYLSENKNDYTDCIKYSLENLESKIKELFNE